MKKLLVILLINLLFRSTCFGAAATMYVTVAGAGAADGTSWANAFSLSGWETDIEGSAEAGDKYYVEAGTYTLTQDFNTIKAGSTTAPIEVIGVKAGTTNEPPIFSDHAFGTDRPLIVAGAYDLKFGGIRTKVSNLSATTADTTGFYIGSYGVLVNCKVAQTGTAGKKGFYLSSYSSIVSSEASCTNDDGIYAGSNSFVVGCYIHDSKDGIYLSTACACVGNIIDTCTATGIEINRYILFMNNTIYNCVTGIEGATYDGLIVMNNIIDTCTTGASQTTEQLINHWDYNCWNNTTDTSNVTKGYHAVTGNPGMANPAGGDFTVGSGSNVLDAGCQVNSDTGVVGDYKWNIGVDQDDNLANGAANDIFGIIQ